MKSRALIPGWCGLRAAQVLLAGLVAVVLAASCGGGVGSGGTGTYASGPITGYGSIIVGGVRYDETLATVVDEDGLSRSRDDLKLGMTVEIESDAIRDDGTGRAATARAVRIGSEIFGPVASVDAARGTFTVLGQTVLVTPSTVFDERLAGGLPSLRAGDSVEVYALYDAATRQYEATRVEPRAGVFLRWHLRGPVAELDAAAKTLRLGSATFFYGGASALPVALAVGDMVRMSLDTAPDGAGRWIVTTFGTAVRVPSDRAEAELEGRISAFTSSQAFDVGGTPVDASAATVSGGSAGLALGVRVEVTGSLEAGILRARTVAIETDDEEHERGFELEGTITAVDAAARVFTLRGETVSWARPDLLLEGGTLADIVVGRRVEVKARLAADGSRLEATKIQFE